MALKLKTSEGYFDLPPGFTTEAEDTSPIYNERGSQTVAATLPPSKNNLRLINHVNRIDSDQSIGAGHGVVVEDDIYHRIGKLNISQVSRHEGIVANIGFDEAEAYNIWNAMKLNAFNDYPVYAPGSVSALVKHLTDVMNETAPLTDYHAFRICVSDNYREEPFNTSGYMVKVRYPEFLNDIKKESGKYMIDGMARTTHFLIEDELVETSLPDGYGVTAFLKVSWILNFIFLKYGYKVIENPFDTHHQLSRLVVLNNAADCCVKGTLNYADLMPDCTVNEFLQALRCRFGLVYFINGNNKTVRLKFIRDMIKDVPHKDFSKLHAGHPILKYNARAQLKLSAACNIEGATPPAETWDDFLRKYDYTIAIPYRPGYLTYNKGHGTYRDKDSRRGRRSYFRWSDFFPWDRKAEVPYEEISSIDECLPMFSEMDVDSIVCPAYMVGKVHRHTTIESAEIEFSEDQSKETPLCFCFSMPVSSHSYPFGSPRCYTPSGQDIKDSSNNLFDISLTFVGENGAFNRFWKEYDAILRYSNHSIEIPMRLSRKELMETDFSKPVNFNGQKLMPDSLRYPLPWKESQPATLLFRTLRLYKPFDLPEQDVHITYI